MWERPHYTQATCLRVSHMTCVCIFAYTIMNFVRTDRDQGHTAITKLNGRSDKTLTETWFDSRRSYGDVSLLSLASSILIHNFLTDELDWLQKEGYSLAEKKGVKYMMYHGIVSLDFSRECSFNPPAIPRNILETYSFSLPGIHNVFAQLFQNVNVVI